LGNHAHSRLYFHGKKAVLKERLKFEAEVLNQLQETINLIKNDGGKVILTGDGKRLGDYQPNFRLSKNLKTILKQPEST